MTVHVPATSLPLETATILHEAITAWTLTGANEADLLGLNLSLQTHPLVLASALEAADIPLRWQSTDATLPTDEALTFIEQQAPQPYDWPDHPKILALVPHRQCEPWLKRCLTSLLQQTQPLTHIVVIDDASPQPPLEIIQNFETITLLMAQKQVGPYRLIQSVIDATDYDAYLFQDADDWSSCDRLENLLQTAQTSGAELIGSQEIRVLEATAQLQAVGYPLNVNQALRRAPGHPLLHPTSLVTRNLVQRLGGFATGLTFGGDTEFLLRAHWLGLVVNSPKYCYFRRKRPNSLTTAPETGLDSPARQQLTQALKQQAIARTQAAAQHQPLDLRPLQTAPPISLHHCWGPKLRWHSKT